MFSIVKLLFGIIERKEKNKLFLFFLILITFAAFDAFTLAMIIPLMEIMIDFEEGIKNQSLIAIFNFFSLPTFGKNMLYFLILFFLLASILKAVTQVVVYKMTAVIPYQILYKKSSSLINIYAELSWLKFISLNSNDLIKTITKSNELTAYAYVVLLQFFTSLIVTLFLTSLLLFFYPFPTLISILILAIISLLIFKIIKPKQQRAGEKREEALSSIFINASEIILSMQEIRILGSKNFFRQKFLKDAKKLSDAFSVTTFFPPIPNVLIEITAVLALVGLLSFTLLMNLDFLSLIPALIFFVAVARRLLPSVSQITSHFISLKGLEPSIKVISNELSRKVDFEVSNKKLDQIEKTNNKNWSEISMQNIIFGYGEKNVLRDINFKIINKKSIALVGPSGAGKSTLINIILGLIEPDKGKFFVDKNLVEDLSFLKNNIGLVPQIINIIDDTLKNNIIFGREYDENKYKQSLVFANLDGLISELPLKENTILGERGINLSGGQRQRIAIARALYNKPDIIIFDEATASLDNINEEIIQKTISNLLKEKTIISVAHRLTSIKNFDEIFILDKGKIVSSGTYEELLEKSELFQKLSKEIK